VKTGKVHFKGPELSSILRIWAVPAIPQCRCWGAATANALSGLFGAWAHAAARRRQPDDQCQAIACSGHGGAGATIAARCPARPSQRNRAMLLAHGWSAPRTRVRLIRQRGERVLNRREAARNTRASAGGMSTCPIELGEGLIGRIMGTRPAAIRSSRSRGSPAQYYDPAVAPRHCGRVSSTRIRADVDNGAGGLYPLVTVPSSLGPCASREVSVSLSHRAGTYSSWRWHPWISASPWGRSLGPAAIRLGRRPTHCRAMRKWKGADAR